MIITVLHDAVTVNDGYLKVIAILNFMGCVGVSLHVRNG